MPNSTPALSHPKYRPDIDGLRAIAVISVVVFHAFPDWLKGGFTGVDVFFVISGFLISTILFENFERGTFCFSQFYARRVKRIFPALLLVLILSSIFGWFALFGNEYKQLGKHIAAGASFVSNIVFWSESGYFDNASNTKPLLHLWSLGIEEQFYIIWPIFLWFAWKIKFSILYSMITIFILSFLLNINWAIGASSAAFYLPQARFWELLSGSLLAWFSIYNKFYFKNALKWLNRSFIEVVLPNALSVIGIILIFTSFTFISEANNFPGFWALMPVMGTVFVISAGHNAIINQKILSNKILVWFGLISFPLYLWHWPILSFARIVESENPELYIRVAAVLASICFAWLTYRFIEVPIRFRNNSGVITSILVLLMIFVGGFGYVVFEKNGIESRIESASDIDPLVYEFSGDLHAAHENCKAIFPTWNKVTDAPCLLQKKTGNTLAIVGDSHALQLFHAMSELIEQDGGVADFPASCAAPYLDISSGVDRENPMPIREGAYKLINSAYDFVLNDAKIKTVILAHNPQCSFENAVDKRNPEIHDVNDVLENGMRRTFTGLLEADKNVIVLFDNPPIPFDPERCAERPFRISNIENRCSFPRSDFDQMESYSNYKSLVNDVLKDYPDVRTYDLSENICDENYCHILDSGKITYKDRNHLNINGSRLVAPFIMDVAKSFD